MKYSLILSVLLVLSPRCLFSQSMDPATRELIDKLLSRVDTLEKRVADLESRGGSPTAATSARTPFVTQSATEMVHADHENPAGGEIAQPAYPSLKISGFSDLDFSATNLHSATSAFLPQTLVPPHSGFEEGQFILHMSSALSPRVSVFGEISLTARNDAGTGSPPAAGFNAEVERAIIRFEQSDYFKLSFGRYHTPINYWNTAFHHGQWLQTTISRPEMTQFGGSFIPVHFVGTLAEGAVPAGGLNLNYNFGLGNGRGQVISRGGDFSDINNNRAWLVNAFIRPDHLYKLQIGGSVYRDKLNPLTGPVSREWIQSAHLVWHSETPELIAEFANVAHQPLGPGVSSNSQAFYVQAAYRLPWDNKLWKPYYRFEYIHVPQSDAIFRAVPSFNASTLGLRFDISTFSAIKFEYRRYNRHNLPDIFGAFSQVSFTF